MPDVAEKKRNKKKKILESAYDLFLRNSVNSTAIDDVVKAAGVAKGTFYLYFKDKHDLLDQLIISKSASLITQAYQAAFADASLPFADRILLLADHIASYLDQNREFAALLQKNLSHSFFALTHSEDPALQTMMAEILKEMQALGYSGQRALQLLYLITDLTGSVCCDAVVRGQPFTLEEIRPALTGALRAILTQGGDCHD